MRAMAAAAAVSWGDYNVSAVKLAAKLRHVTGQNMNMSELS